jgi:LPS-assembly lipoprotein
VRALLQWVAVIIFSSSLIGCGFHLRGNMALPPQYFHKMFIKTADPYGRLTKNLQEYLKKSSVELVTDQNDAPLTLQILSETKAQLLQSVSGTAQNRQYSLTYTVVFKIIKQ